MRKIYSLLIALFLLPFTMVAENQGFTKEARTSASVKTDSRAYIQPDIIRAADGQPITSHTVATWFKINKYSDARGSSNNMVVMGYGGREHCNDNGAWNFCINSQGIPTFTGWGGFSGTSSASAVSVGEWHHIVASYDASTMTMTYYLDAEVVFTKQYEGTNNGFIWFTNENPAFYFGAYCFNGMIDEVQVWNKALTADEVATAKSYAGGVDGLVGLYTFDETPATVGTFPNQSTQSVASAEPCYYENVEGTQAWENGVVFVISGGSYSKANPTLAVSDRQVVPNEPVEFYLAGDVFEEGRVELTATDGTTTYATQAAAHMIMPGTQLTLTATPAAGYTMAGYVETVNGVEKYFAENAYTVTAAGASVAAYAVTDAKKWDMTVVNAANIPFTLTDPWNRDVTSSLTGLYGAGDAVEYKLVLGDIPADYDASTLVVKLGEDVLTAENGAYAIASAENATLTITVTEKAKYTVTINQPAVGGTVTVKNGAATVNSGDQVPAGTVLTLSKTAQTGYQFTNYIVNGTATTNSTVTVNADVTISVAFEEGALEYCTLTGTTQRSDSRGINSLSVSDNAGNSVSVAGPGTGTRQALYVDQTGTIFTTEPGARITIKNNGSGNWMHSYVYIDLNQNGVFEVNEANCRGANVDGELMSHTGYTGVNGSDPTQASDGSTIDYGTSYNLTMPSFTLPTDMAPGTYRVRHKVDWNCVDPCGRTLANGYSGNFISDNGGGIIDFVIRIESPDYDTPRTITVASANDAQGSVAITNPATTESSITTTQKTVVIKATAAAGYGFLNWTDAAGNVVSTDATYKYTGAEDASFTANFGYVLTYSVGTEGSATFTSDGVTLASGAVLAPGAEVTIVATPNTGKFLSLIVAGTSVEATGNTYTFTMEESTNVQVNFVDAIYRLTIELSGQGEILVTDAGSNTAGPSGNEYTTGSDITGKNLKLFVKPADGESLEYLAFQYEGAALNDITARVRPVTVSGYEGWYYAPGSKANSNCVVTVRFTGTSGIDEIGIDPANGPVEYYNLQGVRVAAENLAPGFYVIRQGEKAAKVFINK